MHLKRAIKEAVRRLRGESGQATTEYAVLVFFTVTFVLAAIAIVTSLLYYFQDIASLIDLPLP